MRIGLRWESKKEGMSQWFLIDSDVTGIITQSKLSSACDDKKTNENVLSKMNDQVDFE